MKKHLLLGILGACALSSQAQTFKEWQDPEVNAVNRAPMHTNFFAYESMDAAAQAIKEHSNNFMTLNGNWKFFWVKMPMHVLQTSGKLILMIKDGMTYKFQLYGN